MPKNCTVRRAFTGHRVGESHPRADLPSHDIALMRELHEVHNIGYGTIASKFEKSKSYVQKVCTYRIRTYE